MTRVRQQTLGGIGVLEGTGLHTGNSVRLRILPAAENTGIRFRRVDIDGHPEISAVAEKVVGHDRGTTLESSAARVQTVEHVLSALAGMEIDNAIVELNAAEPPAADGSAMAFVELIEQVGITTQKADASVLTVTREAEFADGESVYRVKPASGLHIDAAIDFDHPSIGRQSISLTVGPVSYRSDIAGARTFGFLREVEELKSRGLAQGGSLDNALVLTETGLHEGIELRYPDEFVRHKILDIIGDLALLGGRIRGRIEAVRPSHRGNIVLAKGLSQMSKENGEGRPKLDIQGILQQLPHRYPLLLVDRILEFEEMKRIVGLKNVTINEPFFVGHFPGHPIMPGVLIIEAMAQVGGLLLMDAIENPEEKIVYFMSVDKVKWRRPVTPGDQIRFEVDVVQVRGQTAKMKGVGLVEGKVVAEAEMMARVVDK